MLVVYTHPRFVPSSSIPVLLVEDADSMATKKLNCLWSTSQILIGVQLSIRCVPCFSLTWIRGERGSRLIPGVVDVYGSRVSHGSVCLLMGGGECNKDDHTA